jgi:very-short-patch-repair endonuclease
VAGWAIEDLGSVKRLVAAGFRVQPQVWVGRYRIDLVVSDGSSQVAVECDGDRYHGVDQIPADLARQAILERTGWQFLRVRGTRFYRNPDATTAWLIQELERLGIRPVGPQPEEAAIDAVAAENRQRVIRLAWEIMREQNWLS